MIKEAGCYNIAGVKTGTIFSPELVEIILDNATIFINSEKIMIKDSNNVTRSVAINMENSR